MVLEKLINNYFKAITPAEVFKNIVCHDDLKEIMARSLFTENRTKTLLLGGPGTAKTLFASEICKKMKNWYFFDDTGTSGRGFIDWMYEHQNAAGIVIDEIDKLKRNEQAMLYNFLESGQIDYQTSKVRYHFRMDKCKVIATTNSLDRLSKPLKSRFAILHIPTYTFEEFVEIAVRLLGENYNLLADVAKAIANIAWNALNCKDVRMLEHIGARIRKDDRADDIERLVNLMIRYGQINSNTEYN